MNTKERNRYQKFIRDKLRESFIEVEKEKCMKIFFRGKIIYSPRIDVAVGPFAFEIKLENEFNRMLEQNERLVRLLKKYAINSNYLKFYINLNPRCFISIELENSTDNFTKYILGSVSNSSILGKIGILVSLSNNGRSLEKLKNFFDFAKEARKIKDYPFQNVAFLTKNKFDRILDRL